MSASIDLRRREYSKLNHQFTEQPRTTTGLQLVRDAATGSRQRALHGGVSEQRHDHGPGKPVTDLPLRDYEKLTVAQIAPQLAALSRLQIQRLRAYEMRHKKRKSLIVKLDALLA